jgi:hypothetical protein
VGFAVVARFEGIVGRRVLGLPGLFFGAPVVVEGSMRKLAFFGDEMLKAIVFGAEGA